MYSALARIFAKSMVKNELRVYLYLAIFFACTLPYCFFKIGVISGLTREMAFGVLLAQKFLELLVNKMLIVAGLLLTASVIIYVAKILASAAESNSLRLALSRMTSYSDHFEVRAFQRFGAVYNQVYEIAKSYSRSAKHSKNYLDGFFYKIIGLASPQQSDVELFIENNFMGQEQNEVRPINPIPEIQMLANPFENNPQPLNLELFDRSQRVYSIVEQPGLNLDTAYTLQIVTKDILQKEIAAREMATLLGLGDLIPPFAVYRAPDRLSAYQNYNMPLRRLGVVFTPDAILNIEQINMLPEEPGASFVILRKRESDENIKKLVYQVNFLEPATRDERSQAARKLRELATANTQKIILLQYILGLRSDLNDLTVVLEDNSILKSVYHSQMMPDNNYACPGIHLMNNTLLPQSTRGTHFVAQVSSENMRSLQLPILALPAGKKPFDIEVTRDFAGFSLVSLLRYHQAKNLFSAEAVCAQFQRLRVVRERIAARGTPTELLEVFQVFDMGFDFNINPENTDALNLRYTHMSKCPIIPYRETQLIFFQWAFDAGVERQKNQYDRLLAFEGRSPAQCEKLIDNYYRKEIREALKRQAMA